MKESSIAELLKINRGHEAQIVRHEVSFGISFYRIKKSDLLGDAVANEGKALL